MAYISQLKVGTTTYDIKATADGDGNIIASTYLKLSGGTLTGPLKILGTAASQPLILRGIEGSDGNGAVGDLYLNYAGGGRIYLGTSGGGNISADGKSYSGNAATATKATQDGSGNTITSTYLKLAGGTMTGVINSSFRSST